jgi:hypothetical protein
VFFAGEAQVYGVTGRDTLDKTTMIPTTAVQHHAAPGLRASRRR